MSGVLLKQVGNQEPDRTISSIQDTFELDQAGRIVSITFAWPTDRCIMSRRLVKGGDANVHLHGKRLYLSPFSLKIVGETPGGDYIVEREGPLIYGWVDDPLKDEAAWDKSQSTQA